MAEDMVKVRIKPFRAIGGYGNAGDEVWMPRKEAEQYLAEGYVEYVDGGELTVDGKAEEVAEEAEEVASGSHAPEVADAGSMPARLMQPEVKRQRRPRKSG